MKTLSLTFEIIGMLFLLLGMCILLINYNQNEFFLCFGCGMLFTSLFLITQNVLLKYGKK